MLKLTKIINFTKATWKADLDCVKCKFVKNVNFLAVIFAVDTLYIVRV